ncbi:MAG: ferrous iron transport protein B [Chloroflexi bacterium]|nr:ferrous iron transport protein B [Chloroflexota bacterium]
MPWWKKLAEPRPACATCPAAAHLAPLGAGRGQADYVVALAGNPNTGKSTLFNRLTGLRQHTGNWPGKTVTRAEGAFEYNGKRYRLVDLPGTYSLLSTSEDEEVARNFLLFGRPDAVIITVDATALERNLNLVLQILEITDRAIVAVNMMDEARRKGLEIDTRTLSRDLGVPAVPIVARTGEGVSRLLQTLEALVQGQIRTRPRRVQGSPVFQRALQALVDEIRALYPDLPNPRWIALRLLDGDPRIIEALRSGELAALARGQATQATVRAPREALGVDHLLAGQSAPPAAWEPPTPEERARIEALLRKAEELRRELGPVWQDAVVAALYAEAERIARRAVHVRGEPRAYDWDQTLDRLLTSPVTGLPILFLMLGVVFWLTIQGANIPSEWLSRGLFWIEAQGAALFEALGLPWWVTGFLWHGVYRGLAWVVSVMLPPMAIFFPLFTFMEDLGLLPRIAFNLDWLFRKAGAHGKQALTMAMGFGCNAAGVVATRIIDSPRERLIAILTNTFVPCNGRYPTLIMLATVFIAAQFPAGYASFVAALAVVATILLGIFFTLVVSWGLSRTVLKGLPSAFTLELPPYRMPNVWQILYTSFIERTVFVLRRAMLTAAPAGGVIWLLANLQVGGQSLAWHIANFLDPLGRLMGLDGVILLAYIIAIPANEIVVPTMIMVYQNASMMIELDSLQALRELLVGRAGWTLLTAANLMLFAILHNPCGTTILTIYKETGSKKWATFGALMPLGLGFVVTTLVAAVVRALGGG